MPTQGFWTLLIGLIGVAIPITVLFTAIGQTAKHGFACTRCHRDVPVGSARCPACNAPVQNSDQPL